MVILPKKLIGENWQLLPIESDDPFHGLIRFMLNPALSPKRMAMLEDKIRQYAREYIQGFRSKGKCEFISEFAFEFCGCSVKHLSGPRELGAICGRQGKNYISQTIGSRLLYNFQVDRGGRTHHH